GRTPTTNSGALRQALAGDRQQGAVSCLARARGISGPHSWGSWSTHLHGIELAHMHEMAAFAAGTDAGRSLRRSRLGARSRHRNLVGLNAGGTVMRQGSVDFSGVPFDG